MRDGLAAVRATTPVRQARKWGTRARTRRDFTRAPPPRHVRLRGVAEEVDDHVLGKSACGEVAPGAGGIAELAERTPCPGDLRLVVERRRDRLGDERVRQPAPAEVRLDLPAARAARAQRSGAFVGERDVAGPAELPAPGNGRRGRLAPVSDRDETRLEVCLGARRVPEKPRRDVERRRRRPLRPFRTGRL